ncbi:MAG TPA: SCO1664 family protein [Anaerolineaceae bacterium]
MPTHPEIYTALQKGEITPHGQFLNGSNYTFLALVTHGALEVQAVYKPARGEQPLWDFPTGSLGKREAAAYLLSEALGWSLVPPTVFRRRAPLGAGSLQLFIPHKPSRHYFTLTPTERQVLRPAALFDLLANNADRKGGHLIFDPSGKIWLIDQGLCFHTEDKLRTVIWDFAGEEIPVPLLQDIQRFLAEVSSEGELRQELSRLLSPAEIAALARRARRLLNDPHFPQQPKDRRSFPWPPV